MEFQATAKAALHRTAAVIEKRPSIGRKTKSTSARLLDHPDGVSAEVDTGTGSLHVDAGVQVGGNADGLSPGAMARGALAACLAFRYAMEFSRRDVLVDDIRVHVETDLDVGAWLGVTEDRGPEFSALRYAVDVTSDADEAAVVEAMDFADAHCPILQTFVKPIPVERELRLTQTAEAAD